METQARASTGLEGFDEVLHGGVIQNNSYLIVGSAGTGKTILSLQWLLAGLDIGEKCLYVALAEPVVNIKRNAAAFGWALEGVEIADLNPVEDDMEDRVEEYRIFSPSEVERAPLWKAIYDAVREVEPDRVVVDSVTQLRYLSTDDYQFRKQMLALVAFLQRNGCTSFLTYEPTELEREASVALAVDGIIRLRSDVSPQRVVGLRSLQVDKMRGSDFMTGYHPMRIKSDGIHIYPHRVEAPGDTRPGENRLNTGIEEIDELLHGGLESGTATILTGPCGAGKTTLGIQFLYASVANGDKAVLFTFEESRESIVNRSRNISLDLTDMVEKDLLRIERVNPMELYPDEFLNIVRKAVQNEDRRTVMLDSLRGYELAMEEFGSTTANIHNLVTYANREGVTTLLINEVEQITGDLVATEMQVSYLVDNIILLRYAEYANRVIRILTALKRRHSPLDTRLLEYAISDSGIAVRSEVRNMQGLLTGTPTAVPAFE